MPGLSDEHAAMALTLLANAGALTHTGEDGTLDEDANTTLRQWDFHDLLFHSRSRLGRHDYPFGGNFRFVGKLAPQPALKPPMSDDVVDLYRPDLDDATRRDRPFTQVLEERQSIRAYGETPITVEQLGEFLYRAARVRSITPIDMQKGIPYETSSRPYPSGGGTYDLEVYVTVNTCTGLESGLYHYDPLNHRLERIARRTWEVERLLYDAWTAAAQLVVPQVLITLASRFQRLSWKHDAIAYAATLKNVGVLYQTMYLVATAMGLAPAASAAATPISSPAPPALTTTPSPRWASSCWGARHIPARLGLRPTGRTPSPKGKGVGGIGLQKIGHVTDAHTRLTSYRYEEVMPTT